MDPLVGALIAGLLGGGATGAIVAGLIALLAQRRTFEHERSARFLDLKRERYAELLHASDEWIRTQWAQLDAVERGNCRAIPALAPLRPIELLAEEIDLLAPADVGHAAAQLGYALQALSAFDARDEAQAHQMREMATYAEVSAEVTTWRNRFVAAAKKDLGTS